MIAQDVFFLMVCDVLLLAVFSVCCCLLYYCKCIFVCCSVVLPFFWKADFQILNTIFVERNPVPNAMDNISFQIVHVGVNPKIGVVPPKSSILIGLEPL